MEDRTIDEALAIAKGNLSGIAKEVKDGVFVFVGVWEGTTGPVDEPVATPFVNTDFSAKSYARWGTHDLTDPEVQRLYHEMRGELPH